MTRPGDAVLGADNVLFAEPPSLLVRRTDTPSGGRVWLEVPDARALSTVVKPFRVATGWTTEVTDSWGNVVGFTDYTPMPERGRLQPSQA